jgi:hypothetical protein
MWESLGNKEVAHEQEVYRSIDSEGAPDSA